MHFRGGFLSILIFLFHLIYTTLLLIHLHLWGFMLMFSYYVQMYIVVQLVAFDYLYEALYRILLHYFHHYYFTVLFFVTQFMHSYVCMCEFYVSLQLYLSPLDCYYCYSKHKMLKLAFGLKCFGKVFHAKTAFMLNGCYLVQFTVKLLS